MNDRLLKRMILKEIRNILSEGEPDPDFAFSHADKSSLSNEVSRLCSAFPKELRGLNEKSKVTRQQMTAVIKFVELMLSNHPDPRQRKVNPNGNFTKSQGQYLLKNYDEIARKAEQSGMKDDMCFKMISNFIGMLGLSEAD